MSESGLRGKKGASERSSVSFDLARQSARLHADFRLTMKRWAPQKLFQSQDAARTRISCSASLFSPSSELSCKKRRSAARREKKERVIFDAVFPL